MPRARSIMRFAFVPALVLGAGCATTGINKGDLSLISIDEEWQLGEQLSADVAKQMTLVTDPQVNAYVDALGRKILAQATNDTPVATRPWHFHVVDNDEINAFNIPGGHVYIQSGLVAQADKYDELAGVMGHEISHGLARHGVENMTKQYGIMAVASIVLGENPAAYEQILASVLAGGAIMKFSRSAEAEADRLGVTYVYRAGIDPEGMVSFFGKLLDVRGSRPSSLEQFFSSHPLTEDRIRDTQAQIDALPAKNLVTDDAGFKAFKDRVAADVKKP